MTGRRPARSQKHPAKVVRFPVPRVARRRRAVRIGSALLALGLVVAIVVRINMLHSARLSVRRISSTLSPEEFRILKLVNDERIRAGQPPLDFSPGLMVAARNHSQDMAAHNYLGHDSPAGDTPADRLRAAGVGYEELAENVFSGNPNDVGRLPEEVVKGWLQSPEHRANLLSQRFRATAVGIARSQQGSFYVTEDFVR
jgi:uncharacterized protein YkwD